MENATSLPLHQLELGRYLMILSMTQTLSLNQNNPMLIQHPVDSKRKASDMLARIATMM
jgi:hypothetical protein